MAVTKNATVVAASTDLMIEAHPGNSKNLICVGCLLDADHRNQSFPKAKLGKHLDQHHVRGHQVPDAA